MCSRDQCVQRGTRDAIVHVGPYVWVGPYVRPVLVAPVSFTVLVPRVRARGRSERREPVCDCACEPDVRRPGRRRRYTV